MLKLMWGILWRMVVYGLVSGVLLGALFTLFIYPLAMPLGAIIGGTVGLVLGLADGVTAGIITFVVLRRPTIWSNYIAAVQAGTMSATAIGGLAAFAWWGGGIRVINELSGWGGWACFMVLPTVIASSATWLATNRVLMWVERVETQWKPITAQNDDR